MIPTDSRELFSPSGVCKNMDTMVWKMGMEVVVSLIFWKKPTVSRDSSQLWCAATDSSTLLATGTHPR